jgi:hypothetical protein
MHTKRKPKTIHDKFTHISNTSFLIKAHSDKCVELADSYAIAFAEHAIGKTLGVTDYKLSKEELVNYKSLNGL